MTIFDPGMMDDGGATVGSKKAGAGSGPQAAKAQQALQQGGQVEQAQVIHSSKSRGDVIFIKGKEYQPTGDTQNRGFAVLTKTRPELQQAIAAKGGSHSHQGDPGVDPQRQERYHQQDRQLDGAIKQKGGQPQAEHSRYTDKNGDGMDDATGVAIKGSKGITRDQMVDRVMEQKNVDRPVAERVVSRAMRG